MNPVHGSIVGREAELAVVRRFVGDHADGPASLTLAGEAGIGKTAIWAQALLDARVAGVSVLACRCSQSDAALSFAGLGDLFDGLDPSELAALPAVQQRALSAALLISGDGDREPGSRVIGVAVLGVLRALARSGPLLLAVDDIQWLDISSRSVLSFALRRLDHEPVRLITSCRTGATSDVTSDLGLPGERLVVGPVSVGMMQRIIQTRLRETLGRPTLTRLHRATGGNPMMCLEMALHERLARTVTDPEERARHAALGSDEPSSVVAAALDSAARHARRRGSIDAAAELAQLALSRTAASDPEQLRRTVDAARYLFLLGDPAAARALLARAFDATPPGPARVDALLLAASIASWESGDATVAGWCEQALAEAGEDRLLLARGHATFAETSPSGAAVDLFHAEAAVELLETMPAPPGGLLANALTNVAGSPGAVALP